MVWIALPVAWKNLSVVFKSRCFKILGLLIGLAYGVTYMYLTGNLVFDSNIFTPNFSRAPSIAVAENWLDKLWKMRAPANWEPVVMLYPLNGMAIFLPLPNILLAVALSTLFSANITLAVHRLVRPASCTRGATAGVLGALPSLLTGFGCCIPTAALALGASLAAGLIAISNFLLPLSIFALALALLWNATRTEIHGGLEQA